MTTITVPSTGVAVKGNAPLVGVGIWFPVAPGITKLPPVPPIVGGVMSFASLVPTANEVVLLQGRVRLGVKATRLDYKLDLLKSTAVAFGLGLACRRLIGINAPAAAVTTAGVAPAVSTGASVSPFAADIAVAAPTSSMDVGNYYVDIPSAGIDVAGQDAEVSATLTAVIVPAVNVDVAAPNPTIDTGGDIYWSNVSLLLGFEGSNGSTTFTDSSVNALSPTVYGSAAITTATFKYGSSGGDFNVPYSGTQSGTWTGTKHLVYSYSNYSAIDLSAGPAFNGSESTYATSWTVEFWFYLPAASTNTSLTQGLFNIGNTIHRGFGIVCYLQQNIGTTYYPCFQYGDYFQGSSYRRYNGVSSSASASVGWNHLAMTYQLNSGNPLASRLRIFINGCLAQDPNPTATSYGATYLYLRENNILFGGCNIASEGTTSNPFYKSQLTFDELRISKGIVRYAPSNFSQLMLGAQYFTPPDKAFPRGA